MSEKPPILNILVVGFHHKKGCQVEFSYPPLIAGTEGKSECPTGWKYLPTLGLPDGSHNFIEDTVFFNLPSLNDPTESIYGVSCYRQIPVQKLKKITEDVTRSTVQKAVCILSRLPIYGYIEVKLSLIADAFFEQGDFECTAILIKAYNQLNACLQNESRPLRHFHVGLSIREIMLKWRHKVLILVKLFMLQKRVICFGSPVRPLCTLILSISSLIPRLLEKGFQEVACVRTSRPMSPMPDFSISPTDDIQTPNEIAVPVDECVIADKIDFDEDNAMNLNFAATPKKESATNRILERMDSNGLEVGKRIDRSNSLTRESSVDTLASSIFPLSSINPDAYRSPITIFASGHLCLPYLSLPYMDLLSDPSVLSYVIGTSNVLFQQKKNLADIQIDVENGTMETSDQDLRRQLVLTTEDLRFVDYIIRHVQNPKEDAEGSEHWIREQFQGYMLSLLKTASIQENQKDCDHFNSSFMSGFKKTQCFQEWYDVRPDEAFFDALPDGHPFAFAGTLSVADMKLKIAQTMHNSESGRKLNQAVNTTSKAVGGAITQAKGAFSNWWSSITTAPLTNNPNATTFYGSSSNITEENQNIDDTSTNIEHNYEQVPADSAGESDNSFEGNAQECIEDDLVKIQKTDGIIEIGKEAEMLDTKKNGKVFIV